MIRKFYSFKKIRKRNRDRIRTLEQTIDDLNMNASNNKLIFNMGQDKIVAYAKDLDLRSKNWLLSVSEYKSNFAENSSNIVNLKNWIIKKFGYHRNISISKKHQSEINFHFDAVILLADKKSVKFIDFQNYKTLSVLDYSFDKISLVQKVYDLYKHYYKTPINNVDVSNKLITEDLVMDAEKMNFEIANGNALITLKKIFEKQLKIIKKQDNLKEFKALNDFKDNHLKDIYIKELYGLMNLNDSPSKYEYLLDLQLPFILQHGDLLYQNFLIKDKEWFLLDFEHSNILPFFYDFLFFIISPAWIKKWNNKDMIDLLMDGKLDFMIHDLFEAINFENEMILKDKKSIVLITLIARRIIISDFDSCDSAKRNAQSDFDFIDNLYSE